MRWLIPLLLLTGCTASVGEPTGTQTEPLPLGDSGAPADLGQLNAVRPMATETVWTGIHNGGAAGMQTGSFRVCYQNSECVSGCCVTEPVCETCGDTSVCVDAKLCRGG